MNQDLLDLALGANRVLTYAGYVLLAGTLTFWSVVWPDGRRNGRLVVLALAGTAAMIIGTLAGPAIQLIFAGRLLGDILTPLGGAAQLARLAALVAAMFFLPDIISGAVIGWRRILALTVVLVIAAFDVNFLGFLIIGGVLALFLVGLQRLRPPAEIQLPVAPAPRRGDSNPQT